MKKVWICLALVAGLLNTISASAGDFENAVNSKVIKFEDVRLNNSVMLALTSSDDALRNGVVMNGYPECGSGKNVNVQCNINKVNAALSQRADQACRLAKTLRALSYDLGHNPSQQHVVTDGVSVSQVSPNLLSNIVIGGNVAGIVKNFQTLTCEK